MNIIVLEDIAQHNSEHPRLETFVRDALKPYPHIILHSVKTAVEVRSSLNTHTRLVFHHNQDPTFLPWELKKDFPHVIYVVYSSGLPALFASGLKSHVVHFQKQGYDHMVGRSYQIQKLIYDYCN